MAWRKKAKAAIAIRPRWTVPKRLRERMVPALMVALDTWRSSPFEFEAACRTGVRASLCLQGWSWEKAETAAVELVDIALKRNGAKRPSWDEGQPDYARATVTFGRSTLCANPRCRKPFYPTGTQQLFCDKACWKATRYDRHHRQRLAELRVSQRAYHAAWSAEQPERACEGCGELYRPRKRGFPSKPESRFCSQRCAVTTTNRKKREELLQRIRETEGEEAAARAEAKMARRSDAGRRGPKRAA